MSTRPKGIGSYFRARTKTLAFHLILYRLQAVASRKHDRLCAFRQMNQALMNFSASVGRSTSAQSATLLLGSDKLKGPPAAAAAKSTA